MTLCREVTDREKLGCEAQRIGRLPEGAGRREIPQESTVSSGDGTFCRFGPPMVVGTLIPRASPEEWLRAGSLSR